MELQFYWIEANPGDEIGHYWGQLAGSIHRLHIIAEELERIANDNDISLALTRLAYHIENYLVRVYELRERSLSLAAKVTGKKAMIDNLRHPSKRAAAVIALEKVATAPVQALSRLLDILEDDIGLRNQHTHDTFLQLGLSTDSGLYDPHDAFLDLTEQPEAKAQLEKVLRGEIERLAEEYKNKINVVFEATWKMLNATQGLIKY
jgi:hypothetical protein